jgi:hypothetical protein
MSTEKTAPSKPETFEKPGELDERELGEVAGGGGAPPAPHGPVGPGG